MDQRLQFVTDALSDRFTMTELCERYGVSRRIGYKWLARFNEDGKRGLADRSRRPHTCPTQIRPVLAELLCEFRRLQQLRCMPDGPCTGDAAAGGSQAATARLAALARRCCADPRCARETSRRRRRRSQPRLGRAAVFLDGYRSRRAAAGHRTHLRRVEVLHGRTRGDLLERDPPGRGLQSAHTHGPGMGRLRQGLADRARTRHAWFRQAVAVAMAASRYAALVGEAASCGRGAAWFRLIALSIRARRSRASAAGRTTYHRRRAAAV